MREFVERIGVHADPSLMVVFRNANVSFLPTAPADKIANNITVNDSGGSDGLCKYVQRKRQQAPSSMVSSRVKESRVGKDYIQAMGAACCGNPKRLLKSGRISAR
jgi:hypothetical protein